MVIFDAPTREKCVVQRQRTNTPLQALVTLNDPQFVEASRALARRIIREGGSTVETQLEFAWRLVTARPVSMSQQLRRHNRATSAFPLLVSWSGCLLQSSHVLRFL